MQITLDHLTPQQAWELAIAYSEITKTKEKSEPKRKGHQRLREANLKYQKSVNYDKDFILMVMEMYYIEKLNINEITKQLNAAGYKTVTGANFRNGGVWYVLFSKQAKSLKERFTNV